MKGVEIKKGAEGKIIVTFLSPAGEGLKGWILDLHGLKHSFTGKWHRFKVYSGIVRA